MDECVIEWIIRKPPYEWRLSYPGVTNKQEFVKVFVSTAGYRQITRAS